MDKLIDLFGTNKDVSFTSFRFNICVELSDNICFNSLKRLM